mgnify:CR=1 FL=1
MSNDKINKKKVKFTLDSKDQSLKPLVSSDSKISGLVSERRKMLELILKDVLIQVGTDSKKVILAQVLIALKLEGILSDTLTDAQYKLVKVITDGILSDPEQTIETEKLIKKLL